MTRSTHLRLAFAFALALACTPREASEPEVSAKPAIESEPAPKPAAVAPAVPTREAPQGPVPGFVLYTRARSILVASDGSAPVIGEGLWVRDDRSDPAPITHTLIIDPARAEILDLPVCACFALAGACTYGSFESRSFDPQTGSIVDATPSPSCTCVEPPEPLAGLAREIDGQHYEACVDGWDQGIASLIAGTLYRHGWDWNGACFGELSIYDAVSFGQDLVVDPPRLDDVGMRSLGCDDQLGMPEVVRPWPFDEGRLGECEGDIESEVYLLRRADLWKIGDNISGVGGWREYAKRPVRPGSCPSINDPCGDPEPFRTRAELDRREREFWIATDGSVALSAEHGRYALWRAESDVPIEFELAGVDASTDVIGVRVHADLRRLRSLIEQHPGLGVDRAERAPTTVDAETCLELRANQCDPGVDAHAWADKCVAWMGLEQWSLAERACLCGLAVADAAATRGALLDKLGSIAEVQGAPDQAAMQYRLAKLELVSAAAEQR